MSLPKEKKITLNEFYELKEKSDQVLEYIDGTVYMSPSPLNRTPAYFEPSACTVV